MESIRDVLCFLNENEFIEEVNNDIFENFRHVNQRLVIKFEDYNVSKLIQVLNIIDDMNLSAVTDNFQCVLDKVNTLRRNIFYLIGFKHFVDSNHPENQTPD